MYCNFSHLFQDEWQAVQEKLMVKHKVSAKRKWQYHLAAYMAKGKGKQKT